MAAAKKKTERPKPVAVKYIGTADVKEFLGLVWDSSSNHTVPISEIDADTLANLRSQPDFRVISE